MPEPRIDELIGELQARLQAVLMIHDRMNGLLEAVVAVGSDLNMETALRRIAEAAVGLTDARYGALGVLGEGGGQFTEQDEAAAAGSSRFATLHSDARHY